MTQMKEITRELEAEYFNLGTAEIPKWVLGGVFTQLDETSNPKVATRHYTVNKNATKKTTGFETQHPFSLDMYQGEEVAEFVRNVIEEQQLGVTIEIAKVRLYEPIEEKDNTYYARKLKAGIEGNKTGTPGELITYSGNFNQDGDLIIGEFNTETLTFTPQ